MGKECCKIRQARRLRRQQEEANTDSALVRPQQDDVQATHCTRPNGAPGSRASSRTYFQAEGERAAREVRGDETLESKGNVNMFDRRSRRLETLSEKVEVEIKAKTNPIQIEENVLGGKVMV